MALVGEGGDSPSEGATTGTGGGEMGNGVLRGMVHETSKRVGVDGRGHYGNRGWVSGLHDAEIWFG